MNLPMSRTRNSTTVQYLIYTGNHAEMIEIDIETGTEPEFSWKMFNKRQQSWSKKIKEHHRIDQVDDEMHGI